MRRKRIGLDKLEWWPALPQGLLGFQCEPRPCPCHVRESGLESRIWRVRHHPLTVSGAEPAFEWSKHRRTPERRGAEQTRTGHRTDSQVGEKVHTPLHPRGDSGSKFDAAQTAFDVRGAQAIFTAAFFQSDDPQSGWPQPLRGPPSWPLCSRSQFACYRDSRRRLPGSPGAAEEQQRRGPAPAAEVGESGRRVGPIVLDRFNYGSFKVLMVT